MQIILFLIITIISGVLSFLTSGIEHLFRSNDPQWYMIPLGYYFLGYSLFLLALYKLKFKNIRVLKFYLLRKVLRLNKMFKKIDFTINSEKTELSTLQEKSIINWDILLKDKSTQLNYSFYKSIYIKRSIQRGSLLVVLQSSSNENGFTLIDTGDRNLYYEVYIPHIHAREMSLYFDKEQEKRFTTLENRKRVHIESIINI